MVSRALRGLREHQKSTPYLWYPVLSGGSESTKNPGRTYGIPCSQGAPRASKPRSAKLETQNPKPDTRKGEKKTATKNCVSFFQLL